jgi:glycosyltransferase involved in cell wall biosynthesis
VDERIDLSIVLPVYREDELLGECLQRIHKAMEPLGKTFECVIVDDGSPLPTWEMIVRLSGQFPRVRALRLSRNFGKEAALAAGLEEARGTLVLVMDADLQHPPELIHRFLEVQAETGANVVEGVKLSTEGMSGFRQRCNRIFYRTLEAISGLNLHNHSDFKLIDRVVRDAWLKLGERALFFRGMVAWLGFHHEPIVFHVPAIPGRDSRWNLTALIRLALGGLTAFSSAPLHLTTLTGVLFFLMSVVLGLQTLYNWASGRAATGFSTVILLQLVIGSLTLIALGLIGHYLSHIYDEVKGRPRYLIRDRLEPG